MIIELTISGRCRRRACADATEGEDADPGPSRRSLTPPSLSPAPTSVDEEDFVAEDDDALESEPRPVRQRLVEEDLDAEDDEALAARACQKDGNSC